MATSRYDNERLRAIEEHLRDEDPGYVRRVERSAADLPEEPTSPDDEPVPQSTFVTVCAWTIGALLLLLLVVSLADPANRDFAATPETAPGSASTGAAAVYLVDGG
ncbi:hypothetical protein F4561_002825 [Lipingzhangella halophila]|uniref:DUF3040 domain-containing protein n=1 Tax=Lipingzhangella halophila TaxID=1783352 RepID=A0A7W7RHC4_9ACTN|nr:DUF3040 domain-containing protein [Lipingzhangella halophila]MBB4932005.1 hypothetical protein [Lipingzhangella halophila]